MAITLLTNKRSIDVRGPLQWSEVSTDKYQRLAAIKDQTVIDIVSIFCDIEHDLLYNAKDSDKIGVLYTMVSFAYNKELEEIETPEWFTFDKQAYKLKKNLGHLSFGQMVMLRKQIENKSYNECVSIACAIYLQPFIDEAPFDSERALELEPEIAKLPITQTYPMGFFFLRKLSSGGNPFINAWNLLRLLGVRKTIKLLSLRGLKVLSHLQI